MALPGEEGEKGGIHSTLATPPACESPFSALPAFSTLGIGMRFGIHHAAPSSPSSRVLQRRMLSFPSHLHANLLRLSGRSFIYHPTLPGEEQGN